MRKKSTVLILVFFLAFLLFYPSLPHLHAQESDEEMEKQPEIWCPATRFTDNDKCMDCHVMSGKKFVVKDTPSDAHIDYPAFTRIDGFGTGNYTGTFELWGSVSSSKYDELRDALRFFSQYGIDHVTMEIYSYGGDLFAAWRIVGLINEWVAQGNTFDTKVLGAAVSAAAVLFAAGQERIAHVRAEIMYHELYTFTFFEVSTPAQTEEKARVLRHLQDNIADWLASRTKLSAKEWTTLMKQREHWLYGKDAFEIGLATKLIGQ